MKEEWRQIKEVQGVYEVSNLGRVRRIIPSTHYRWKGRIGLLKLTLSKQGRFVVTMCVNGIRYYRKVHKLVATAFIGPCPRGKQVNHIDLDPTNNRSDNLEYLTNRENSIHAHEHGAFPPHVLRRMGRRVSRTRKALYASGDLVCVRDELGRYNGAVKVR
jgi:hypothetical protein